MAHPDLDQIANGVLAFAQKMLNKHGEFYPFGSSMDLSGKIAMDGATNTKEHPGSQELLDLLSAAYAKRAEAGELRAAAICADVRITPPGAAEKTDAISIGLEHSTGEAVSVFLPYHKGWFGRIRYGTLFVLARDPKFFSASGRREPGSKTQ